MKKHPFKIYPDTPQPLSFSVSRRVRFEEVDALGIVWHGRYPSYFEDVREALGDNYGIGYLDFFRERVAAPLRQLHFDYLKPLSLRENFTIKAQLHWSEAARLNLTYEILNEQGELTTSGYSIQMMVDHQEQNVLMVPPPFFQTFLKRWQEQKLNPETEHA
jgi:acyl-CoA thioester hydrolase